MDKQNELMIERIKERALYLRISVKHMIEDLGLGKNTLTNFKTSAPSSKTILAIADYLDVSVDYLLGLTDIPDTKKAVGISADSPDDDTEKAIAYLNYLAQTNPEALQKAAEYAKFLAQDNQ